SAIDPPTSHLRLLLKNDDASAIDGDFTKSGRRVHGGDGCLVPPRKVVLIELAEVNVGNAVAGSRKECLIAKRFGCHAYPRPSLRGLAGVDKHDPPVLNRRPIRYVDRLCTEIDDQIGLVVAVVEKIITNGLALVTEAQDEIANPEQRIDLHD